MIMKHAAIVLAVVGACLMIMSGILYMGRHGGLSFLLYTGTALFGGLALLAALVIGLLPNRRP